MRSRLASRSRRRRVAGCGRDREAGVSTIEAALVLPVVLFAVLVMLQGGLWFSAREVAQAAAHHGAVAAAAVGGSSGTGASAANAYLAASSVLHQASVRASRSATLAQVSVAGQVPVLWPGFTWSTSQSSAVAVERFTAP